MPCSGLASWLLLLLLLPLARDRVLLGFSHPETAIHPTEYYHIKCILGPNRVVVKSSWVCGFISCNLHIVGLKGVKLPPSSLRRNALPNRKGGVVLAAFIHHQKDMRIRERKVIGGTGGLPMPTAVAATAVTPACLPKPVRPECGSSILDLMACRSRV